MTFFSVLVRPLGGAAAALVLLSHCGPGDPNSHPDAMDAMDAMDATIDAGGCPLRGADSASVGVTLEIGTGRDGSLENYRALAPGDVLYVTPGEQGLQHLLVALRGTGFNPQLPLTQVRAYRASDCEPVGEVRFRLPYTVDATDSSTLEIPTFRVTLVDDNDRFEYCTILNQDVDLMADLDDGMGHTAHRELRIHVGGIDPNARPDLQAAWLAACDRGDGGADAGGSP